MLHLLLYALLAVLLAGALFLVAARLLPAGEQIAPPVRDEPPWDLPAERVLTADDIDEVRLPVTLRGYRFAETDALLDRLADELRSRDAEISRLRGEDVPALPDSVADEPTDAGSGGAEPLPFDEAASVDGGAVVETPPEEPAWTAEQGPAAAPLPGEQPLPFEQSEDVEAPAEDAPAEDPPAEDAPAAAKRTRRRRSR